MRTHIAGKIMEVPRMNDGPCMVPSALLAPRHTYVCIKYAGGQHRGDGTVAPFYIPTGFRKLFECGKGLFSLQDSRYQLLGLVLCQSELHESV